MSTFSRLLAAVLPLALACLPIAPASAASGVPSTVGVRVLGAGPAFPALLPLTEVTTTAAAVEKAGGSCAGTSAAGALELATGGNWDGKWNSGFGDYEVISIEGQAYPFDPESNKNYFWSLWLNGRETATGICGTALETGDQVLFFPSCFGSECPAPPNVLVLEGPAAAEVGTPVAVTVLSYPGSGGEPGAAAGAIVSAEGVSDTADSSGHVVLTFARAGSFAVRATAGSAVPGEARICVHTGQDGTCGTRSTAPSSAVETNGRQSPPPYTGPFALVARALVPSEGRVYRRGHAPRLLSGQILAHTAVTSVSLELHRRNRGRCSEYDAVSERFVRARCGHGRYFKVSESASFSYLLPAPLGKGRYVLDVQATDAAGNRTTLARGTSRIVFYVR
jgi:hypothetical protein